MNIALKIIVPSNVISIRILNLSLCYKKVKSFTNAYMQTTFILT